MTIGIFSRTTDVASRIDGSSIDRRDSREAVEQRGVKNRMDEALDEAVLWYGLREGKSVEHNQTTQETLGRLRGAINSRTNVSAMVKGLAQRNYLILNLILKMELSNTCFVRKIFSLTP